MIKGLIFFIFILFSFQTNAEINIDQWEDDDKTYQDLLIKMSEIVFAG